MVLIQYPHGSIDLANILAKNWKTKFLHIFTIYNLSVMHDI